jgi:hypothetical protein
MDGDRIAEARRSIARRAFANYGEWLQVAEVAEVA